jgi:hypothetical protein
MPGGIRAAAACVHQICAVTIGRGTNEVRAAKGSGCVVSTGYQKNLRNEALTLALQKCDLARFLHRYYHD